MNNNNFEVNHLIKTGNTNTKMRKMTQRCLAILMLPRCELRCCFYLADEQGPGT